MTYFMDESEYSAFLAHYGTLRKSGRYPYGSGGPENASNKGFLDHVATLKSQGLSEKDIAEGMGITTTQLRAARSIARNEHRADLISQATRLQAKGYGASAIARQMGVNESSVRSLLSDNAKLRNDVLFSTANMLKQAVAEKDYVDVGTGVESYVGVSKTKLANAIALLKEEGYGIHYVKEQQVGTGHETTVKVLAKPNTPYKEVYQNRHLIEPPNYYSEDGGLSHSKFKPPLSISSTRVGIRYAEQGGDDADGVMYIRPGVEDVSIGGSKYAQVRVAVDGTHYIKGMAMYKDDLPAGVDIQFNTNKSFTGNKLDALKEMKKTPDGEVDQSNPFGSSIRRQILDPSGSKPTSAMNLVYEQGDWADWKKSISSQVLSKQSPVLARQQLDMTHERATNEFDEIMSLNNPTVRRTLLESFADSTDSSAVHLQAAALPRQATHVILPVPSLKENEIYAPNYRNGERVALVRFPHGGKFEIPEVIVNNNHAEAKNLIGTHAPDAIGMHPKIAKRLSGADFDGDTVLVIPNNSSRIKTAPPLAKLKDFNPQLAYPAYDGMPKMKARTKQVEMGVVSNLITDMTIRHASNDELAAAVRHSMVVIDAEKHNLNYKQSALDNNIAHLKAKYQTPYQTTGKSGASTLISRATSEIRVADRVPRRADKDNPDKGGPVDKATGRKMYQPTGKTYVNKKGETVQKTISSFKLAETDDARTLSSGTVIEKVYADHSNKLKALANQARREAVHAPTIPYSPSARKAYNTEVQSLNAKLNVALRNAPLERKAQLIANAQIRAKKDANPHMTADDLKKVKSQALTEARNRTGAGKIRVDITDREWEAVQHGAISTSKLRDILKNADLDRVKELATPRTKHSLMTGAKTARAKSMAAAGYTQAEIADALGVSMTTLKEGLM